MSDSLNEQIEYNAFHEGEKRAEMIEDEVYQDIFSQAYYSGYKDGASFVQSRHTEQPEGWVSVEDRLPEIGETVLAYRPMARETHDPITCITSYDGKRQKSPQGTEHGFDCWCHPTHWQPLPKPPEEE